MYFCFSVDFLFIQTLDVIDGIQGHQFFDFYLLENILGLLTKSSTVNQEQNSLESVALNKAIDHAKDGTGFAGAGSHGQQDGLLTIDNGLFCRLNRINLILTQIQSIRVTEQIERRILECGICGSNILFELLHQSLRTDPTLQGLGCIGSAAQIQIPDAGFGFDLLEILSAIGRKGKRNFICSPLVDDVLLVFIFDSLSILLTLMVNDRGNVNSGFFSFHNAHELHPDKQGVICVTILTYSGVSRPLSNGKISTLLRPGSLRIAQSIGVSLPTKLAKLLVNQIAGFSLGKIHALGCGFTLFRTFLGCLGRCCGGYRIDLLGERSNFFFLFLDDSLIVRLGHIFGHDKFRGNISPVTVYLHEPDRKIIGHGE